MPPSSVVPILVVRVLVILYLCFVTTGFVHEGGHSFVGKKAGVELSGFSPSTCLLLQCRVYPLAPLEGWEGSVTLWSGGLVATLWWLGIYCATSRRHIGRQWWMGVILAGFASGEMTTAVLEGGWNGLYTKYSGIAFMVILLAMSTGLAYQLTITRQWWRLKQLWVRSSRYPSTRT